MDKNTHTISTTVSNIKQEKTEVSLDKGTWRSRQAIDLVIDYIMQEEDKSPGDKYLDGDVNTLSF